jgi:hypothetical protein
MNKQKRTFLAFLAGLLCISAIGITAVVLMTEEIEPAHRFLAGRVSTFAAIAGGCIITYLWVNHTISQATLYVMGMLQERKVANARRNGTVPRQAGRILDEWETPSRGRPRS